MKLQNILLIVFSVIALILGTWGFYQAAPERGFLTSVYLAIQLFSMNSGVVEEVPTPLAIEVARWLALGTLLTVVYAAIRALLDHLGSSVRLASMTDHTIICGVGQRGEALALRLDAPRTRESRGQVVAIEIDENSPALSELKNAGIEVIIGNATDASVLMKAGLKRAKSLIAVTGNDELNLSICADALNIHPNCHTTAGLETWAWRNFFLDRVKDERRVTLASFLSRATHGLMLEVAIEAVVEPSFRRDGLRVLIEASNERRQELMRSAILMLQISGNKKLRLVITSAPTDQRSAFLERFPASNLVADIEWHSASSCEVFPEKSSECPDFAIFALSSEIETLEFAERFWMRHSIKDSRVIACLSGSSDSTYLKSVKMKEKDFSVKKLLPLGLGAVYPLDLDIDPKAKRCHEIYYRNEIAKNVSFNGIPEKWEDLPERLKESNRLAARHNVVKVVAWQNRGTEGILEMLSFLSRCEHMRWMAEKAMDGWRWSGSDQKISRDNSKLKHHLLVEFDVLQDRDKDKDFAIFLWALDLKDTELEGLELSEDATRMIKLSSRLAP